MDKLYSNYDTKLYGEFKLMQLTSFLPVNQCIYNSIKDLNTFKDIWFWQCFIYH